MSREERRSKLHDRIRILTNRIGDSELNDEQRAYFLWKRANAYSSFGFLEQDVADKPSWYLMSREDRKKSVLLDPKQQYRRIKQYRRYPEHTWMIPVYDMIVSEGWYSDYAWPRDYRLLDAIFNLRAEAIPFLPLIERIINDSDNIMLRHSHKTHLELTTALSNAGGNLQQFKSEFEARVPSRFETVERILRDMTVGFHGSDPDEEIPFEEQDLMRDETILVKRMKDADWKIRAQTIGILSCKFPTPKSWLFNALAEALTKDRKLDVRLIALDSLAFWCEGEINNEIQTEIEKLLIETLKSDGSYKVRCEAAENLAKFAATSSEPADAIGQQFAKEKNIYAKSRLICVLGQFGELAKSSVQDIVDSTPHENYRFCKEIALAKIVPFETEIGRGVANKITDAVRRIPSPFKRSELYHVIFDRFPEVGQVNYAVDAMHEEESALIRGQAAKFLLDKHPEVAKMVDAESTARSQFLI